MNIDNVKLVLFLIITIFDLKKIKSTEYIIRADLIKANWFQKKVTNYHNKYELKQYCNNSLRIQYYYIFKELIFIASITSTISPL